MLGSRQLIIDGETKAYRGVILSPHNRGFRGPIERCVSKIKESDFPASKISLFFRHQDCSWSPVGGTSDFLVTGMIEWRLKWKPPKSLGLQTKPKKIPAPKFNPQKIPWRISEPLKFQESINLYNTKNTPPPPPAKRKKNSHLYRVTQNNTCQNVPTQKKSQNGKFQTKKNPSIIPVAWNPEYPPGSWSKISWRDMTTSSVEIPTRLVRQHFFKIKYDFSFHAQKF